jgi:hypothetical protein
MPAPHRTHPRQSPRRNLDKSVRLTCFARAAIDGAVITIFDQFYALSDSFLAEEFILNKRATFHKRLIINGLQYKWWPRFQTSASC